MSEFESEIVKARDAIKEAEAQATKERAKADTLVSNMRESGANLLERDNFEKVDEAYKASDAARDEANEYRQRLTRLLEMDGKRNPAPADTRDDDTDERLSGDLAKRFVNSDQYRTLRDSGVLEMSNARVQTTPFEAATREEALGMLRLRTTVDATDGSGGGLVIDDRKNLLVAEPVRRVKALDIIATGTTDSDTVEWVEETTMTDAAAETPYGTAAPEAAYGYTPKQTTVQRIPHFVPAQKGVLADAGQLQTLLRNRLRRGVRLRVEKQVVAGDGTGDNLTGIYNTTGIGSIALDTDTRWDAVHKAITNVRVNLEDDPFAIGIHPNDYEQVVLEKDSNGNYVHGRPAEDVRSLWGLTPVISTVFTEGKPLVGDFEQATLWLRAGVSVAASDSHTDFFTKGLVAILAELRAAFAVTQAKGFCEITGF